MNSKELYERQVREEGSLQGLSSSLGRREAALLKWILSVIDTSSSFETRIAEISIGDGQLGRALVQAVPSVAIDGIDISPKRISHCQRLAQLLPSHASERLKFVELDLDSEFHRLNSDTYRIVVAIDVLEHIFDPFAFVQHCKRILKCDGYLFLRVPNLAYLKRRLALFNGKLPVTSSWFETPGSFQSWKDRHGWDGGHLHYFTIDALEWLLASEGFRHFSWKDVGAKGESIRRLWPAMLFGNLAVAARKASSA